MREKKHMLTFYISVFIDSLDFDAVVPTKRKQKKKKKDFPSYDTYFFFFKYELVQFLWPGNNDWINLKSKPYALYLAAKEKCSVMKVCFINFFIIIIFFNRCKYANVNEYILHA